MVNKNSTLFITRTCQRFFFVKNLFTYLARENLQGLKLVHILAETTVCLRTTRQELFLFYVRENPYFNSRPHRNTRVFCKNEVYIEILFSLHRIREHIADKAKLPILIFPEGRNQLYIALLTLH